MTFDNCRLGEFILTTETLLRNASVTVTMPVDNQEKSNE